MNQEEINAKARELVEKYYNIIDLCSIKEAKQCALIDVTNTWNALEKARVFEELDYYNNLKQAIENL